MLKRGTLFIFIALLALIATPLQAASIKAGASCAKLGATSTFAGLKFTCIKSGKKLVWSKGISSKSPTDIKNLKVLENSWTQINQIKASPNSNRIVFLIDPKFPSKSRDAIKNGMNLTITKFDYLFKVDKPIYAIFSTSLEFELAQFEKYSLMQQNYELEARANPTMLQWRKDHYKEIETGQKDFASGGTMPLYNGVKEPAGYYMYFRLHPDNQDPTTVLLGAHETGHLLQWQLNWDFPETLPAWWIEGQAQMIGENVAAQANDFYEYENYLKAQAKPKYGGGFFSGTNNLNELEGDSLTRSQFNCPLCGTRLVYSRGKVAINYLAGTYGNEKVMTFVSSLSRENRWWQSFEKTFGISIETFYAGFEIYAKWFADYFSPGWEKSPF